ncbi:hypothetical protein KY092_17065 [Natronomonas gomsonensis]|uniref:hypothetical protein n=1 Tax=Natronomonas gomsonensis TaxID=1046043 RepID=UPI00227B28A7|nr:hypothetical protein [Natronomonas gomsonensis]MCY4732265.1 hypothetical protein [Natronomonas gomsonensis]
MGQPTADQNDTQLGDGQYPRGASADGFTNATTVLETHQTAVAEDSYRLSYNFTMVQGTTITNTSTVVTSNASQQRQRSRSDLPRRTIDEYYTADGYHIQQNISGTTVSNTSTVQQSFGETHTTGARPGPLLSTIVRAGNYTATGTEQHNGRTVLVYNTTNITADPENQLPETIESASGQVKIDRSGRIWTARLTVGGRSGGTRQIVHHEFSLAGTQNVSVREPAWLEAR